MFVTALYILWNNVAFSGICRPFNADEICYNLQYQKYIPNDKEGVQLHSGCACMERAAKNTSSGDIIAKFLPKFYKNFIYYKFYKNFINYKL